MPITVDDKKMDISNLYDALAQAYTRDIESYKEILKTFNKLIEQKEKELQDFKNKAIFLLQKSVGYQVSEEIPKKKKIRKKRQGDVSVSSGKEIKSKAANQKKEKKSIKGKLSLKELAVGKMEPELKAQRSKKNLTPAQGKNGIKCLYHPDAPTADKGRQLCSSCKWKLTNNGLMNFDKDPAVISFLKGETSSIPNIGQPMCPVHPDVPAYNKKTGLCQKCQSKAKAIGMTDRQLTVEELELLRNPVM